MKLGVVSNFDTRLRPLLRALNCENWFDAVAVSAEVRRFISSLYVVLFLSYTQAMSVVCVCVVRMYLHELASLFTFNEVHIGFKRSSYI